MISLGDAGVRSCRAPTMTDEWGFTGLSTASIERCEKYVHMPYFAYLQASRGCMK
jgi:hypothetical protein